jgi:hypothetical protein
MELQGGAVINPDLANADVLGDGMQEVLLK